MLRVRLLLTAPVIALGLAGCGDNGSPGGSSPSTHFTDWDCSTCHVAQADATLPADPPVAGLIGTEHAQKGRAECLACHAALPALEALHTSSSGGTPPAAGAGLDETAVAEATCLGCHDSWADLAARTASSTVLTDNGEGEHEHGTPKTVNPHVAPTLTPGHEHMTCRSCHGSHAQKSAQGYCVSCHHTGAYEACAICHDE